MKAIILKSVNAWKGYKKRVPSRVSPGARAPRSSHTTRNVYSQLSGLEDVGFNDFINDDSFHEVMVKSALGEYKCDVGMSVERGC